MMYNTFWWDCPDITPEAMHRLKDAEQVVALKYSAAPNRDYEEIQEYSDHFSVINNGGKPVLCHQLGGRGYISSTVTTYPRFDLNLWSIMEAQAEIDWVDTKFNEWRVKNKTYWGGYQHLKAYMKIVVQNYGGSREPSHWLSDELMDELHDRLADQRVGSCVWS